MFLSGFWGDEEEERDYNKQVEDNKKAKSDYALAFRGSPFERFFTEQNPAPAGMPVKKQGPLDKMLSKEFNNHIFTSKSNSYTEKENSIEGIINKDYYYAEKDGKRYRANSKETVNYYDWNSIDEKFLNGTFEKLISEAEQKPTGIVRILTQSIGGDLDFKKKLDESKLYLANGVLYNKNEAGNFIWAYFLESKKVSAYFSGALAQFRTYLPALSKMNGTTRWDEEWDVRARWAGVKYYYEKNNMMWLYDLLYGDTAHF